MNPISGCQVLTRGDSVNPLTARVGFPHLNLGAE